MNRITFEDAKARIRIPDLWAQFNLPGTPSKSCRCPFHDDRKNSFSVTPDGLLWNCFGECAQGGDAIDFLARVCQLERKTACRTFLEMAGGVPLFAPRIITLKPAAQSPRAKPMFPAMDMGTRAELDALAKLRGIGREGLEWAGERGLLRFATFYDSRAWIVTDGEGVNAQARRMDGGLWEHLDGTPKAWTLPGSWASWPLGIREAANFPAIALCEGGGDFLAAHYFAVWEQASHHAKRDAQCAPVAMLGASQRIHADALPLFAGKEVRIFCHADEAGQKAARQWAEQLATVDISADAFDFTGLLREDGKPAKDLNDCLLLNLDGFGQTERILP